MVGTLEHVAQRAAAAGGLVDQLSVHADEDDAALRDALERRAFTVAPVIFEVTRRLSRVGDDLVDGRVEAQRAKFAPSTLTGASAPTAMRPRRALSSSLRLAAARPPSTWSATSGRRFGTWRLEAERLGVRVPGLNVAVRSDDTPAPERRLITPGEREGAAQ